MSSSFAFYFSICREFRGSIQTLPFRKHNTLPVVANNMSEITFQQEFMISPSATQSAELLANWQPVFKKTLFGKKSMPPPPALCSLFITSGHLKVDLMDGEHKIGEYTLEPNTAIISVNLDGYVEAFALLNSVIHISPQKKKKKTSGYLLLKCQ